MPIYCPSSAKPDRPERHDVVPSGCATACEATSEERAWEISHCAGEIMSGRGVDCKRVQTALLSFVGAAVDIRCARCGYEMVISVGY